jgi:hypothetical protein
MANKEGQSHSKLPAAADRQKQHVSPPKVETHSLDDHQTAADASPAATNAGSSKELSPAAHSDAPTPQHSKPVLTKHGKAPAAAAPPPAQPAAGTGAASVPSLQPTVAAGGVGGKSGASRSGSIKRHGSTTSRRLQALLASDELSSLNLLATEGSELPGKA